MYVNFKQMVNSWDSRSLKGYFLVLLSAAIFVVANCLVKGLYSQLIVSQVQFLLRVLSAAVVVASGIPSGTWNLKEAVIPAGTMTFSSILWSYAIFYATPGDCLAVHSSFPLVTACIGYFFWNKPFPKAGFLPSLLFCIVGTILIMQPAFIFGSSPVTGGNLFGYFLVSLVLFTYATYVLQTEHTSVDSKFLSFLSATMRASFWGVIFFIQFDSWKSMSLVEWLLILVTACCLAVGDVARNAGTPFAGSVPTSFVVLLETPFTYLAQDIFLNLTSTFIQLLGVFTVLAGVCYFIISKYREEKEEEFLSSGPSLFEKDD